MSQPTPLPNAVILVSHDLDARVARITVNRPDKLNALNAEVLEQLERAVVALERDTPQVIRVTGAGDKAFVAGADIRAMQGMSVESARAFASYGAHVFERLSGLGAIVVAEVQGFALGGGFELALACDIIVASTQAKFGLPEVGLGLIPGFGGTQRLTRRIGYGRAVELVTTGRTIGAAEAQTLGIINDLTEPGALTLRVDGLTQEILSKGAHAAATAKRALRASYDLPLTSGLGLEATLFSQCFAHPESAEGITAFVERRAPKFS
jgi:enoyl-CoA hydratase